MRLFKVEKDTMGKQTTSIWIFLNFIYIVIWDLPNKISKFEKRFPGLFKKYSLKELPPSEVQKNVIFFSLLPVIKVPKKNSIYIFFNFWFDLEQHLWQLLNITVRRLMVLFQLLLLNMLFPSYHQECNVVHYYSSIFQLVYPKYLWLDVSCILE